MSKSFSMEGRLVSRFLSDYPIEAAQAMESLPALEGVRAFSTAPVEKVAAVLRHMNRFAAAECLRIWPEESFGRLFGALGPGPAARFLRILDREERRRVLSMVDGIVARPIKRLLSFPEDSAGALMDPNVLSVVGTMRVTEALEVVRRSHSSVEDYIYVVDRGETLSGVTSLKALLSASPDETIDDLKHAPVQRVLARSSRPLVASHEGWSTFHAMPVVDLNDALLGVISCIVLRGDERKTIRPEGTPCLLAIGEMYWTAVSSAVEMILHSSTVGSKKEIEE